MSIAATLNDHIDQDVRLKCLEEACREARDQGTWSKEQVIVRAQAYYDFINARTKAAPKKAKRRSRK